MTSPSSERFHIIPLNMLSLKATRPHYIIVVRMEKAFPEFRAEGVGIPRVLIGINPFLGYSHFSEAKSNHFKRIFADVSAISDVIVKSTEFGITGIYTPADKKIAEALKGVEQQTGIRMAVVEPPTIPSI